MPPMIGRECGSCSACCKVIAVKEIGKPVRQRCVHQKNGGGCAIYDSRPSACRDFYCAWRSGLGNDEQRPDISKIILTPYALPAFNASVMQMWEVDHGALNTLFAQATTLHFLDQSFWIFHMPKRDQKKLFIPYHVRKDTVDEVTVEGKRLNYKVIQCKKV